MMARNMAHLNKTCRMASAYGAGVGAGKRSGGEGA